jgi:hypothetical protein
VRILIYFKPIPLEPPETSAQFVLYFSFKFCVEKKYGSSADVIFMSKPISKINPSEEIKRDNIQFLGEFKKPFSLV